MLLAGDIGGTNARLALYDIVRGRPVLLRGQTTPTAELNSLEDHVEEFLDAVLDTSGRRSLHAACFSLAGPVRDGTCRFVNAGLVVCQQDLEARFPGIAFALRNDLVAMGRGLLSLGSDELLTLTPPDIRGKAEGVLALLAPGTGLGEAYIQDGEVRPSEGSHTEFGPRNELEAELWSYLHALYGHVSYERIVSGPGLENLYRFLTRKAPGAEELGAREISRRALVNACPVSLRALDLFLSVLGAEAGNLALKVSAEGGVCLGGNILQEILPGMGSFRLLQAFTDKGRYRNYLEALPVRLILNDKTALLGAALIADSL